MSDANSRTSATNAQITPTAITNIPTGLPATATISASPQSQITSIFPSATGLTQGDLDAIDPNNTTALIDAANKAGYNSTCLQELSFPITIQNASSWVTNGCSPGFFCPNNTEAHPPQYCLPTADCLATRLTGGMCKYAMGIYEPIVCPAKYYCPNNGTEKIICPAGSYCHYGSVEPKKCGPGSRCPQGTERDMSVLPLGIVIIVDFVLITLTILDKLYTIYKRKHKNTKISRKSFILKKAVKAPRFRQKRYQEIDESSNSFMRDIEMEPRSLMRRPTGFQELGALDADTGMQKQILNESGGQMNDLQLFVQSLSKCLGASKFGLSFEFTDLGFKAPKSGKVILSDVSGTMNAGSLWGVMGASGAGKSTFVNVLMGKTTNTSGVTKVNGVAGDISKYKKIIGYVPQDDIVLPEMTVRENILHSARIRLPANWTENEIQHHVDILLNCLQLDHVQDSLVGSPGAPVISGGQRKRVSIGMELAAAPMALFLDEPTSGLDATAAASIMATLKALSRLGMTIVTIIHQPRQEIFESLDSLVLLGAGRMIYCGPQRNIQMHLENRGFIFPDHSNPADIMGDIIAGEGRQYKPSGDASVQSLIDYWAKNRVEVRASFLEKAPTISVSEMSSLTKTIKQRGAPWYRQISYCFRRSMVQQYRMKSSFYFEIGVGALAGFLIGLAHLAAKGNNFRGGYVAPYSVLSSAVDYASIPQMSLLVGLAIGLTASAPGVKIFGEEKLVYWREAASGHNRFAYYIGKTLSTFPRMLLACFHFTTLFYLLATPRIQYMESFIANLLYFWCIYGLAAIISMITRREDGPLIAVMSSLVVGVLNGMSPQLTTVRKWHMVWLWRSSPGTWLSEAYFTENLTPLMGLYDVEPARQHLGYELGVFGKDLGLLVAIGVGYRVAAFVGLRFMWRNKQR